MIGMPRGLDTHLCGHHFGQSQRTVTHGRILFGVPQQWYRNGPGESRFGLFVQLSHVGQVFVSVGIGIDRGTGKGLDEFLFSLRHGRKEPSIVVGGGETLAHFDDAFFVITVFATKTIKAGDNPRASRKWTTGNQIQSVTIGFDGKDGRSSIGCLAQITNTAEKFRIRVGAFAAIVTTQAIHD
eukprot:scaffold15108_cov180-Amphora_coffeaeformis.AAC.21